MLKVFTQHRYLLWQFTKRQIEQRHRGSALGLIWGILQPLMMMAIYTAVFNLVFKGRYSGASDDQTTSGYALAMFLSITIFQTIGEVIGTSATIIISQPNLVKKVVFPLEILPVANLGATLYQFIISLFLTLLGVMTLGNGLSLHSLLFLVTLMPLIPITLGLSLLLSSLGVFLRDIQYAAGPVTMVLMYTSAVFYSAEMLPPALFAWFKYNPILHVIEQSRAVLLWHHPFNWHAFIYSSSVGFVVLAIGIFTFRKLKPAFADVL
jgi:lipopolysaccharide transport system permease protein